MNTDQNRLLSWRHSKFGRNESKSTPIPIHLSTGMGTELRLAQNTTSGNRLYSKLATTVAKMSLLSKLLPCSKIYSRVSASPYTSSHTESLQQHLVYVHVTTRFATQLTPCLTVRCYRRGSECNIQRRNGTSQSE